MRKKTMTFRWVLPFMCLSLFVSCSKESGLLEAPIVNESNGIGEATFIIDRAFYFPNENIQLTSTGTDPDNDPLHYSWTINGQTYEGVSVNLVLDSSGNYEITHTIRDNFGNSASKTKTIEVKDPEIIVRLRSITFGKNVGDGDGNKGEIYLISQAFTSSNSPQDTNDVQQNIFPGSPDKVTPIKIEPNSFFSLGGNSGVVLFHGQVNKFLGFSMVIVDHDKPGFDWTGFFKKVFKITENILAPFIPEAKVVGGILQEVTELVDAAIEEEADDVIARFQALHLPKDRWGIGEFDSQLHFAEYLPSDIRIVYSIELVDR